MRKDLKVGWVGTGIMGRPMALNLLRAGYALHTCARRPSQMAPLVEAGATACAHPSEVAAATDLTFIIVSDTPDVVEVINGKHGIRQGAQRGHLVVDMSTIAPSETQRLSQQLAEHGIEMLDAPVSGGEQGAIEGNLSIMVGGPESVFKRVQAVLEILGAQVHHIGESGAGQVAKACNQLLVAQTMAAVAEALLLAEKFEVRADQVRKALLGGFAYSRILEVHGQRMLDDDYQPGFKAALHLKDLRIVAAEAQTLKLNLPGSQAALALMEAVVAEGGGDLDSAAIARIVRKLAAAAPP